jgi:hypothetical protein
MRVLNDNVWVNGRCYATGTTPPADVMARIGAHAFVDELGPGWTPAGVTSDGFEVFINPGTPGDAPSSSPDPTVPPVAVGSGAAIPDGPGDGVDPTAAIPVVVDDPDDEPEPVDVDEPDGELSVEPAPAPIELKEPPRVGRGASAKAWAAYAEALGVELSGDMGRDDIIAAVDTRAALLAQGE